MRPFRSLEHAVVVEDRHLAMRKDDREEIVVRAVVPAARLRHARGGGRAVMAVGDIDRRQRVEGARQRRDGRVVVDHPHLVAHAVVGGDVDVGCARGGARQHGVDLGRGRIGHHHRAGLGVDGLDLADAVVLLQRRGQLVLAHAVRRVVGERGDAGEPGLHAVAPGQPVDVVAGLGVAHEHAGRDHAGEVLGRLGVDGAVIRVDRRIEVDLGLGDVQEAPRLALGALARLRAREHVIGRGQDFGGAAGRGTQRAKGLDERQEELQGGRMARWF